MIKVCLSELMHMALRCRGIIWEETYRFLTFFAAYNENHNFDDIRFFIFLLRKTRHDLSVLKSTEEFAC